MKQDEVLLLEGDCLEKMLEIPSESIDLILCDPPYGTTQNKWDAVIPLKDMWRSLDRICKENTAIVFFACEPFASHLRISNLKNFKYDWVWDKKRPVGQLNAKRQPLRQHEMICVFYKKQPTYRPIFHDNRLKRTFVGRINKSKKQSDNYGEQYDYISNITEQSKSYPRSIISRTAVIGNSKEKVNHPTQKPVALLEYLIETYTNQGDRVLDFTMGSGSTGVAAVNTNRRFIGIEKDSKYFQIAETRISEALAERQTDLFRQQSI